MDRLDGRAPRLHARGLPPRLARGRRPRRDRALRHLRRAAGHLHDAPAADLRRHADPGRPAGRPVRLPQRAAGRRHPAHGGPDGVRVRRRLPARAAGPGVRRRRRRDDLHLRAAAGQHLVPAAADPAGHPAHRHPGPARRGRRRRTHDLGAGAPRLDPGLPRGRVARHRPRGGGAVPAARLARPRGTCAASGSRSPRCGTAWPRRGRTRAPGSASGCTSPRSSAPP